LVAGKEIHAADNQVAEARVITVARRGVRTGADFADFMSALMSDVILGAINPGVAQAAVNAGGKLLKVTEMQFKYGRNPKGEAAPLHLTGSVIDD